MVKLTIQGSWRPHKTDLHFNWLEMREVYHALETQKHLLTFNAGGYRQHHSGRIYPKSRGNKISEFDE